MAAPTTAELAGKLQDAVTELQSILSSSKANIRGTYEAALAEAQGAEILMSKGGGTVANHLNSLREGSIAIRGRLDAVQSILGKIKEADSGAYSRVRHALQGLLDLARGRADLSQRTIAMAEELEQEAPARLAGAPVGAMARGAGSSVSSQIGSFTGAARAQWNSLIPLRAGGQQLLNEIRALPETLGEAGSRAAMAAAAARASITAALQSSRIPALLRAIGSALEAMWTVGGTLISVPILIIPLDPNGNPIGTSGRRGGQEL